MKHRLTICVISETPETTACALAEILPEYRFIRLSDSLENLHSNMIVIGSIPMELLSETPQENSVIIAVYTREQFNDHIRQITEQSSRDTKVRLGVNPLFNSVYVHDEGILTFRYGSHWNSHPRSFPSMNSFAEAIRVHWRLYSEHHTMLYRETLFNKV